MKRLRLLPYLELCRVLLSRNKIYDRRLWMFELAFDDRKAWRLVVTPEHYVPHPLRICRELDVSDDNFVVEVGRTGSNECLLGRFRVLLSESVLVGELARDKCVFCLGIHLSPTIKARSKSCPTLYRKLPRSLVIVSISVGRT